MFRIHEILLYLKLCQGLLFWPRNVSIWGKFDIVISMKYYWNCKNFPDFNINSWEPYHVETSPLICRAIQWASFYMIMISY